jgi:hypothetical protein
LRTATHCPAGVSPPPRDKTMQMWMQKQGLTPRVQRGHDPWLRAQILRVRQQGAQRIADGLKQQRGHHRHIGQPQCIEVMGQGEDHMEMIAGQEPSALEGKPALGLKARALGAGAMPTRVVPHAREVAVRALLDMTAEGRGPALHDGARGFADVGGQGMGLLIGRKGILEDRLQCDERHRCLRTRGRRRSLGCFIQYHANYPRDKRLVQR